MFIIDRFEDKWAIIETDNKVFFKLPRSILPDTLREGDCVEIAVSKDSSATAAREKQATELLHNLVKKREEDFFG
ncbi:MAG: DUF3006 domain-containing protein [Desulfitobacteriia bacterium]|jgi:hypothetical protein